MPCTQMKSLVLILDQSDFTSPFSVARGRLAHPEMVIVRMARLATRAPVVRARSRPGSKGARIWR